MGATVSYNVIGTATVSGSGTVDFGLKASLPDSAKLTADTVNKDASSATGFSGGSLDPIFDITKGSASLTLTATSQPKISFGIKAIGIENFDVEVAVKLPEISATLTAAYDEAGVCSHDTGASKTGVNLSSKVDFAVDLQINDQIGKSGGPPAWSKELFATSEPLPSKCFPINIPGLEKSSKTMASSVSTNSAVGTSSSSLVVPSSLVASASGTAPMPTAMGTSSSYAGAPSSLVASASGTAPIPTAMGTSSSYVGAPSSPVASASGTAPIPTAVGTSSSYVGAPSSPVASAPTPMSTAAVPTTTNVPSARIGHVKHGSSGCRLARRHGKRLLIC
ncbi:hypothetical protein N7G274_008574 [Stereocaulon virgatum]|uniref:DUF7223 domain-containing protein n=1 Tax=Stereocaulon virgatum TaxID=373712 RepID=A0ABR4A0K7_9LECA